MSTDLNNQNSGCLSWRRKFYSSRATFLT